MNNTNHQLSPPARSGVHAWRLSYGAAGVLLAGFLTRIYLLTHNPIVNPDGFYYIQQAKALHYGLFGQILNCYKYLSPYPIFIALAYRLLGNWVLAAQWVNIFFGTLTIIPLYWLLKRFFEEKTAWISVMVYALLPAFVLVSSDLLRGPTFWFFGTAGLYLFTLYLENRRPLPLLLSSICFAVGAWSRIEGGLFIIVSAAFIMLLNRGHRLRDLALFLVPYFLAGAAGLLAAHLRGLDLQELLKPERLFVYITGFFDNYRLLREQLRPLADIKTVINAGSFFPEVRHLVWLIALDALIVQMAETLFYFFFLVLIVGLTVWTARIKNDRRVAYLWILSLSGFALLYAQIIYSWYMTSRFLAVFLFPAFIFMGAGIEWITGFLSSRCRLRGNWGNAAMVLLILAFLLPKNLWANFEPDKLVFHEIADYIVGREHFTRPVSVCGAFKRIRVIHFFANVDFPGAPCFEEDSILKQPDEKALKQIPMRGFDYFVWNQDNWKNIRIESLSPDIAKHFSRLREWPSGRVGKLVLYKVIK
jgi:hypothetical protein